MKMYYQIAKFNALIWVTYPLSIITTILSKVVTLGFLIMLWQLIAKGSSKNINLEELSAYFLISDSISTITMAYSTWLGKSIRKMIKRGEINQYLVKPINLVPFIYSYVLGAKLIQILLALLSFIIGIIILPPHSFVSVFIFILSILLAFAISFAFNLFEGTLAFITAEATGIKNAIRHVVRIFSGKAIPLTFFPKSIYNIAIFSPFPSMIYAPTVALKTKELNSEVFQSLIIALFWAITLNLITQKLWRKYLKLYEGVGI
jgi:ABC-2 type transport system permease protein